jgi:hypothetical protein
MATKKTTLPTMLIEKMTWHPVGDLKRYPQNPRIGNKKAIAEVIKENGFAKVLMVQKSTMFVLDGNHTHQCATELGYTSLPCVLLDVDDKRAAKIVLAANRLNDLATYNTEVLELAMETAEGWQGTGYTELDFDALHDAASHYDMDAVNEIINPPVMISADLTEAVYEPPKRIEPRDDAEVVASLIELDEDQGTIETVDSNLQGALQLREDVVPLGDNYYGIPDLDPDMLLEELPNPLKTWGGVTVTPPDGVTSWLWNYGVSERKGLPHEQAILCFYTHDYRFEPFWEEPAFYTAKMINLGIHTVMVPDFSFYDDVSTAGHVYNTYRAQWLGRYFQEAGLKVIPRMQFSIGDGGKSMDFALMGIPVGTPIIASSIQNVTDRDQFKLSVDNTRKGLRALQPKQWLVYGGKAAQRHIEAIKPVEKGLCDEVVFLLNYAGIRRGVVFDKKEGIAGQRKAMKQESKLRKRDPNADEEDLAIEEPDDEDTPD